MYAATLEGVGAPRRLDRPCERDLAYRWPCGDVAMNRHGLSDFRVGHAEVPERPLTASLAAARRTLEKGQRQWAWGRRREPEAVKDWRERMEDETAKPIHRRRSRIETLNASLKGRGLGIMRVRSIAKVGCVVLPQALAYRLECGNDAGAAVALSPNARAPA